MSKEQLKNLPTPELDDRLQAELRKDIPDGDLVREILRVLEEREKDQPVEITPQIQAAWNNINREEQGRTDRPEPTARSWVKKAAAVVATAAVLCVVLLGVIPQSVRADTWWKKLFNFTDSVFQFFNSSEAHIDHGAYTFQTDNPGLQEVYDAVVELGVTVPVVPMWIPEEYELDECIMDETYVKKSVSAYFLCGEDSLVYRAEMFNSDVWHEYHKDEMNVDTYETNGVIHNVIKNKGMWVVIWERSDIECSILLSCQESTLYKVIDSIYSPEGR